MDIVKNTNLNHTELVICKEKLQSILEEDGFIYK